MKHVFQKMNILELFLTHPTSIFHVRQVARLCNTSPATAGRELKKYEEMNLLSSEEKFRHKFYQANLKSLHYQDFFQYFTIHSLRESNLIEDLRKYYLSAEAIVLCRPESFEEYEFIIISKKTTPFPRTKMYENKLGKKLLIKAVSKAGEEKVKVMNGVVVLGRV